MRKVEIKKGEMLRMSDRYYFVAPDGSLRNVQPKMNKKQRIKLRRKNNG